MFKPKSLILAVALVMIFTAGCGQKEKEVTIEDAISVETGVVKVGNISENLEVNGTIAPSKELNIVSAMGGKVENVNVKVGQVVKRGTNLIKLETKDVERQVKQTEEGVKSAEAALKVSEIAIEPLYEAYLQANQAHIQAKQVYDQAKNNGLPTETAEAALKMAQDGLKKAENAYIQATGDPDAVSKERKNSLQAEMGVKQAKAALDTAKAQLNNSFYKSSINGLVSQVNVSEGNMTAPSVPMVKIINIDNVYLKINVAESALASLEKGEVLSVHIGALKESFEGEITSISPQADSMTKSFPVEVKISNENHKIKPGMTAKASLPIKSKEEVVTVPKNALLNKDGIQKVFVINKTNVAEERTVEIGLRDTEKVEIIEGVVEGETVVLKGQHKLKNKTKVKILN